MKRTAWLLGLTSIAIVTSTRTAHALGPVGIEVAAKAGAATNPYGGDGTINPLGFGLGGRAGVVLMDHLYAGINVMYYLGSSGPDYISSNPTGSISEHTLMYGVEAGWGFQLIDILTIRPQVGLGNATFSFSGDTTGLSYESASKLYFEPGVTGLLSLGTLFVGADANLLLFPALEQSNAVFTIHGQVGVKF
jgi:hypothetical protein